MAARSMAEVVVTTSRRCSPDYLTVSRAMLVEKIAARLARAARVAAEVGAATLLTVVADTDRGRALERFGALCDVAASCGLDVALEFMRWSQVSTIDAAAAFRDEADRPNAGICIDALHLSRSGGDPAAIPPRPRAGSFLQMCDARSSHRRHADRSVMDRALLAGQALRAFLARHDGRGAAGAHDARGSTGSPRHTTIP